MIFSQSAKTFLLFQLSMVIFSVTSQPIRVAGTLDSSFNPSGLWITDTGDSIPGGGYPGSIIIDLGGFDYGNSVATFDSNGERIIIGGRTNTGPGAPMRNLALVVLTETGALDRFFNPSGFWITSTGASVPGGYSGSIIIELGGDDFGQSVVTFDSNEERIIIGGFTTEGPPGSASNFALVVLTETGALDSSFNPDGFWISFTGASFDGGGYPGSIIIDLGGSDFGNSVATFQADGERIIIGGNANTGPGAPDNFALVVLTETGALDSSFNPSGSWITETGASIPGGYPGSIIIDLGGVLEEGKAVATFDSNEERIIIGGRVLGAGPPGSVFNFALVVLTETGALDSSFNPNGFSITSTGASVTGGYAGSIIIDLGVFDDGESVATFDSNGERIIIGGYTDTGPGAPNNFALVVLTETGALDSSFNPNGYWITSTGASITGGYAGSIIIDLGGNDFGNSVATFDSDGERIIIGGFSTEGPPGSSSNFALVVLTETGVLDNSFNPSGSWITDTGASMPGEGYAGSIIIDLGGSDAGRSVATFDSNSERIIIGGRTNTGPGFPDNFALVVLNGETIFPPTIPPLNPLLRLPFVPMAAT